MKFPLHLLICLLILSSFTEAKAPVWKISKGSSSIYIGGTIHVLGQQDYPLPKAFDQAYKAASILVFETDMQKMQSPETQMAMITSTQYPPGTTISDKVSPQTRQKLTAYLDKKKIPFNQLAPFKPGMLMVSLTLLELQAIGMAGAGVDAFYSQKAISDKKQGVYLETLEEQINLIANLGEGREDELVRYTLEDLTKLPETMSQIKHHWRNGENKALNDLANKPMEESLPEMYAALLKDRNIAWIPQLEKFLSTSDTEFVLVGALHLAGKDGVIRLLEKKGYSITQLD